MEPREIMKAYPQVPQALMARPCAPNELLPQDQIRRVINGTIEERKAVLKSLDPDKRQKVLAVLAPQTFPCAPESPEGIGGGPAGAERRNARRSSGSRCRR